MQEWRSGGIEECNFSIPHSSIPPFLQSSISELLHFVLFAGSLDFVANLGGKRGG
jgi:hypothetical protein